LHGLFTSSKPIIIQYPYRFVNQEILATPRADYEAVSEQMSKLYYKGFTEDEITRFEGYLERIQQNLEEKLKA